MRQFIEGQTVRLKASFKTFAGSLVDPTTVTFLVRSEADGNVIEEVFDSESSSDTGTDIVRVSTGIYYLDVETFIGGFWSWRVASTEPDNAMQGVFYAVPALIEPDSSSV